MSVAPVSKIISVVFHRIEAVRASRFDPQLDARRVRIISILKRLDYLFLPAMIPI